MKRLVRLFFWSQTKGHTLNEHLSRQQWRLRRQRGVSLAVNVRHTYCPGNELVAQTVKGEAGDSGSERFRVARVIHMAANEVRVGVGTGNAGRLSDRSLQSGRPGM
jgi:hypothetical protein